MPAPHGALPTSSRAQKCGMVMSVTTQIIFPYMSDARAPAMDIRMTPQDTAMALSFMQNLSAIHRRRLRRLLRRHLHWCDAPHASHARGRAEAASTSEDAHSLATSPICQPPSRECAVGLVSFFVRFDSPRGTDARLGVRL